MFFLSIYICIFFKFCCTQIFTKKKKKEIQTQAHTKNLTTAEHLTHYCSAFLAASLTSRSGSAVFSCLCFCLLTLLARPTIIYEHPTTTTTTESCCYRCCCCCCSGRRNTNTFCILCIFCIHMYMGYMHVYVYMYVDVERIYLSACHFNNLHDVLSSLQISYSHTCLT